MIFGVRFLIRLVQVALALTASLAVIYGFSHLVFWGFRLLWDNFEAHFENQAKWFAAKFQFARPWKLPWRLVVIWSTFALTLFCVLGFIVFVYISGQSAEGSIVK